MIVRRIRSEVVAHLSYLIGSDYEALVVDPRRDPYTYVDIAKQEHLNIEYVFETHRNEDYVIGSRELASLTGAEIYHGPWPAFRYGKTLTDGQEFKVGNLKVVAIHTPGHTPGCMSYAVWDLESGEETVMVCTGDALFVNDVGRTDFAGPAKKREWSEHLYNSIFNKILPLGDHVILCPAHGAGSVCGAGIAEREWSTLGLERLMNPVLQKSKEDFIEYKISEHHEYAPYFGMMERLNVEGAPFIGYGPNPPALKPKEFKEKIEQGAVIADFRPAPSFGAGHIKGAYSIALERSGLAGWVLPYDTPILLVLQHKEHLDRVATNLARIGYDNLDGHLAPSMVSWYKAALPIERLDLLTVMDLEERLRKDNGLLVLDVRSRDEWLDAHIEGSLNLYAGLLQQRVVDLPEAERIAVICESGTRSSFACSILLRAGRKNISNVLGGMGAWKVANYPVSSGN